MERVDKMNNSEYNIKTKILDGKKSLIRPANINDAEELTKLYIMGGERFLYWAYGKKSEYIYEDITKTDFVLNSSYVFEIDNKIVGLLCAYPKDYNKKQDPSELNKILKNHLKGLNWFFFLNRTRKARKYLKFPDDVFHISIIAVFEKYRRRGIGSELLLYAEDIAKKEGYKMVSGETQDDNIPTIKTCEKNGYKIESEIPLSKLSKIYKGYKDRSMLYLSKNLN